jgi:hypothetical protein
MISDEIIDIIKQLLISDKIKIGFYQEAEEWEITRVWKSGRFYGVEITYSENNKDYTSVQTFNKSRVDAILRDNKLNKLLNGL